VGSSGKLLELTRLLVRILNLNKIPLTPQGLLEAAARQALGQGGRFNFQSFAERDQHQGNRTL
jgi:hypothetical protein